MVRDGRRIGDAAVGLKAPARTLRSFSRGDQSVPESREGISNATAAGRKPDGRLPAGQQSRSPAARAAAVLAAGVFTAVCTPWSALQLSTSLRRDRASAAYRQGRNTWERETGRQPVGHSPHRGPLIGQCNVTRPVARRRDPSTVACDPP